MITTYFSTSTSCDDKKKVFYENLGSLIKSTSESDKLIVVGNFNTRVDRDYESWKVLFRPHGVINTNGLFLLTTGAGNNLIISKAPIRLEQKYKTTWMHPRSKQWHLVYYIITCRQDIYDVKITKDMFEVEYGTKDRAKLGSIINLHLGPVCHRKPKLTAATFSTTKLEHPLDREMFHSLSKSHYMFMNH